MRLRRALRNSFYDYFALRLNDDGKLTKVGEFGAYVFGKQVGQLQKREFHLIQAGEPIDMFPMYKQ